MKKLILNFKSKDSKKIKNPKNFLGGKGANLSKMGRMGLPVPPGFTISTKVCEIFYTDKKKSLYKRIGVFPDGKVKPRNTIVSPRAFKHLLELEKISEDSSRTIIREVN